MALKQVAGLLGAGVLSRSFPALAIDDERKLLWEASPENDLPGIEKVTTASGLQYQDIEVGKGPSPITGFQVVCHYVAMTPQGRVFDSSLDRGKPYDFRYGVGVVLPGLDEGLKTMKVGGLRRLYIPGELAFPNGVPAAAGRPRVPPLSPVVFDVKLLLVPGLDNEEEF